MLVLTAAILRDPHNNDPPLSNATNYEATSTPGAVTPAPVRSPDPESSQRRHDSEGHLPSPSGGGVLAPRHPHLPKFRWRPILSARRDPFGPPKGPKLNKSPSTVLPQQETVQSTYRTPFLSPPWSISVPAGHRAAPTGHCAVPTGSRAVPILASSSKDNSKKPAYHTAGHDDEMTSTPGAVRPASHVGSTSLQHPHHSSRQVEGLLQD
jgi:hypothetical protein